MSYQNLSQVNIRIDRDFSEHVLWISLNRPDASNAFTLTMIDELLITLEKADVDSNIRCIILTGEGKHFCAGGDIKNMLAKKEMFEGDANELREKYKRGIQRIPKVMDELTTPVIAMINGAAIGAGLDIACMSDIRIASERAKFGETFARIGLIPGDGGTYFLQRTVGFAKAMELTLTAEVIDASEAKNIGLISIAVSSEDLKEQTKLIAKKILMNAPIASQMAKRAIKHAYRSDLSSNLELLSAFQGISQRTSDHFEALEKAQEKSPSNFKHL
jgi:2-(1,2-epoxy-1,2-dihydrophenyl)acetyl-CoA isomerase